MRHESAQNACGACCTQLQNLTVQFENQPVLRDVSLHLHCGEVTAIIGPNGAGKTTLLKAILHQIPYRGTIAFSDAVGARIGAPRIGYVPQNLQVERMAPVTVLDFVGAALLRQPAFLRPSEKKRAIVEEALSRAQAQSLADYRLGTLSGGEMQRVLLALALAPMPDLLLLDEPVTGIDAEGLAVFYRMIDGIRRAYDVSILLISHDFAFVRAYADRVVLLDHTIRAHGSPHEVMQTEAFAALFPDYVQRGEAV